MIDGMDNQGTLYKYVREKAGTKRRDVCAKEGRRVVLPCTYNQDSPVGLWPGGLPTVTLLLATVSGQHDGGGVDLLHTHGRLYPLR